jgi:hypothetical protein
LAVDDDFDAGCIGRDEVLITVHPIPKIHVAGIGLLRVYEKQFEHIRRENVQCVVAYLRSLDIGSGRNRGLGREMAE